MNNSVSGEKEMTEIKLPGVNISHLKKAVKFMYTGKLNISMREIKNDHLVWHINNILVNLFKIDAKLNLPTHLLTPPPKKEEDTDDDNPPGDGSKDNDQGGMRMKQNLSNGHGGSNNAYQSNSHHTSDIENTRQNNQMKEEQVDDEKPKEGQIVDEKPKEDQIKVEDVTGQPEEFVRNVATPDIIDLLDSDDEDCDNNNYFEGGNLDEVSNDHPEEAPDQNVDLNKNHENQCNETESIKNSPQLRPRGVKRAYSEEDSDDQSHEPVSAPSLSAARRKSREGSSSKAVVTHVPVSSILSAPSPLESQDSKSIPKVQDTRKSSRQKKKRSDPIESPLLTSDLLQTAMDAVYIPTLHLPNEFYQYQRDSPGPSSAQQTTNITPAPVVARKSVPALIPVENSVAVVNPEPLLPVQNSVAVVKPPASSVSKGVRTHHHIPWTVSGLKRPETLADLGQPKMHIHECQVCGAKFDHLKSLTIHIGRYHNHKSMVPCPEGCGKMLTTQAAIRKHLLSHRPEEEWPHKCPLCPKKFQARGDIPKHLKTRIHEADNVPDMGTRAWFDLIYHDDPTYVYENKMQEFNKKKARGKMC